MPATGQDVAAMAKVSTMTVSRVFSGNQGHRISPITRERVLKAARELDYQPNTVARSLRGQRTNTIGFFTSQGMVTAHDPFFAEVVNGIREGCGVWRKRFLLFGDYMGRPEDEVYGDLMSGHLDGLVVQLHPFEPLAKRLAESSLPVVAIADSVPALPSVVADDREGSRMIAKYLAGLGHRRILYRRNDTSNTSECFSVVRRHNAFREAADELGMTILEGTGIYDPVRNSIHLGSEETRILTGLAGDRPTAAVCCGDSGAYGLMSDCRRLGLRVPDDLAIVGFDGAPTMRDQGEMRLTTICASWANVARTAMSLVLALQEGEEVPRETVLPVKLVIGDTT